MLQIQNIKKQYVSGDLVQTALNGVSLTLRESELVAILGPSGSGKTTLLNVIGGLDRYDSGDLIIDGISTKNYNERDWDSYRNHTIGFVFQSYNLIPHQTVLSNVELALTISGIPRSERRKRAIKALEDVGLGNQLHKKPNQMSGGQMQRVAIARALVNDPRILLADEPTGALDSDTSVQVMELLKEVAKDRLVVMVTHNPELAMDYANRIVRVKDGNIIDDTNPYQPDKAELKPSQHKNMGKSSMSFGAALALSFNNLKSKKARTLLTAFAGSIGIIGIALIMALSSGFQNYIDHIQEDTLSNYPLMVQSETADMTSAFAGMMTASSQKKEDDAAGTVIEQPMIYKILSYIGSNDLASFKVHLDEHYGEISHTLNAVQYDYGIKPRIYAENISDILQVNPASLFQKITGSEMMSAYMDADAFHEMIDNQELLDSQYDVLQGRWPQAYNELVFVLPAANRLPDSIAYTLGLKNMDTLDKMMEIVMNGQEVTQEGTPLQWSYDELMSKTFRLISVPDLYQYNADYKVWEDMSGNAEYMAKLIEGGEQLRVVGIVCPKDNIGSSILYTGIAYHPSLTRHVIETAAGSQIVQDQLSNMDIDVFSGKSFDADTENQAINFKDMISIDKEAISKAFGMDMSENVIIGLMEDYMEKAASALDVDTVPAENAFKNTLSDLCRQMLTQYILDHADSDGNAKLYLTNAESMVDEFLKSEYAQTQMQQLANQYSVSVDMFAQVYKPLMMGLVTGYIAQEMSESLQAITQEESMQVSAVSQFAADAAPSESESATEAFTELPTEESTASPAEDTLPSEDVTVPSIPDTSIPSINPDDFAADLTMDRIGDLVSGYADSHVVSAASTVMSKKMMESTMMKILSSQIAGFGDVLMRYMGSSFYVNEEQLAHAFQFNMDEDDLSRLMAALSAKNRERSANTNLKMLGYADWDEPSTISFYMVDFAGKEEFITFLEQYNEQMAETGHEEKVIRYTDMTGMMMSSVRTIIESISYVLIAFVAVSLIVSSIMIGIITYISVMERTKEIGVLRAMGASRHNISQVFNAETYIIGLCSGLIGIGVTLLLLIPGNEIIHSLMGNSDITATLPVANAIILVVLSMFLTLLGGLIPAKQAAKKDPVIALRSE